jgi:hypothetical protein
VAKDRVDRDEEDLVRLYLSDIGQYTLLTKDDEVRLAKQIEAGKAAKEESEVNEGKALTPAKKRELRNLIKDGENAERSFVQSNLRLVVSIAKKYQASGLPCLTSSKRATSVSCTPLKNSTGVRASNSRRMPRGGFVRRLLVVLPTPAAPSASQSTLETRLLVSRRLAHAWS